jgi:hypothetical protein
MLSNGMTIPAAGDDLIPVLFWNPITSSATGAPMACPQCAGPHLHLDTVHFAIPTDEHYTPGIGVSINTDTGAVIADNTARALHDAANRGPMLSIGYWCENGCQGRVELRQHKGHLFASLHETGQHPDDLRHNMGP